MLYLLRIGSRYVNLAYCHINLAATHYYPGYQQDRYGLPPSSPAVTITLLGEISGAGEGFGCEVLEYYGPQYEPVKRRLEEILGSAAFAGIDLPTAQDPNNDPGPDTVLEDDKGSAPDPATGMIRGVNATDLGLD